MNSPAQTFQTTHECASCRDKERELDRIRKQLAIAEADAAFWEQECRDQGDEINRLNDLLDNG